MNKTEVATLIRSLLSSATEPMSVHMLNLEFKNETGCDIPLFGCKDVADFLRSIPETVAFTGGSNGLVSLVKSSKSAHIVSLVQRQKSHRSKYLNKRSNFKAHHPVGGTSVKIMESNSILRSSDVRNLHEHLMKCPDGSNFNEMKKHILKLTDWDKPLELYNIMNIIKTFPFCIFYNGKFYAEEIFTGKFS